MESKHNFNIGDFEIIQRYDNGYFSADYLCFQFNRENGSNKRPFEFLRNNATIKRMAYMRRTPEFKTDRDYFHYDTGLWLHPGLLYIFICWLGDDKLEMDFWQWFLSHNKHKINKLFNLKSNDHGH